MLHVHTANTEALEWYQHRGFKVSHIAAAKDLWLTAPNDCMSALTRVTERGVLTRVPSLETDFDPRVCVLEQVPIQLYLPLPVSPCVSTHRLSA